MYVYIHMYVCNVCIYTHTDIYIHKIQLCLWFQAFTEYLRLQPLSLRWTIINIHSHILKEFKSINFTRAWNFFSLLYCSVLWCLQHWLSQSAQPMFVEWINILDSFLLLVYNRVLMNYNAQMNGFNFQLLTVTLTQINKFNWLEQPYFQNQNSGHAICKAKGEISTAVKPIQLQNIK